MGIKIYSIGSSSSGNSYVLSGNGTNLILDTGLSGKKIKQGLAELGIRPADVSGILVTHEHIDHVKSIRLMSKSCENAKIYVSRGTAAACDVFSEIAPERISYVAAGEEFDISKLSVKGFGLSHDANEPLSFSFSDGRERLSVITDTGIATDEICEIMRDSDKLVFESNHEEEMLLMGPYPYSVKRRILGEYGHLSNKCAGQTLATALVKRLDSPDIDGKGIPEIMLAHLSTTNNTPHNARWTVMDELSREGFEKDRDYRLEVALKEGVTAIE